MLIQRLYEIEVAQIKQKTNKRIDQLIERGHSPYDSEQIQSLKIREEKRIQQLNKVYTRKKVQNFK